MMAVLDSSNVPVLYITKGKKGWDRNRDWSNSLSSYTFQGFSFILIFPGCYCYSYIDGCRGWQHRVHVEYDRGPAGVGWVVQLFPVDPLNIQISNWYLIFDMHSIKVPFFRKHLLNLIYMCTFNPLKSKYLSRINF